MVPGIIRNMDWKLARRGSNEKPKPSKKDIVSSVKADKKPTAVNATLNEPYTLKIRIESPPLVAYGPPEDSSGALLSGILDLYPRPRPKADTFEIGKLEMNLVIEVSTKRPIGHNCPACTTRSKVLHTWIFIPSRMALAYNNGAPHGFPFSFLLPGNLPATTRSSLATICYKLVAEATPPDPPSPATTPLATSGRPPSPKRLDKPVTLIHPLRLSRSILPAAEPKHSHRIFPPTTLTAAATLPTIICPGGTDDVDLTLSGLNIPDTKLRWSLRKISWRIDEISKVVSAACAIHAPKVGGIEGKGILYEDKRVVGTGELKTGWKRDLAAGKVECVLPVGTSASAMAACHVDAMSGVHVSHNLVIECVVAEEMHHASVGPARQGGQWLPTGNARVLRMTFPMVVTDRPGMGISWDEEIPPRYEDVAWNAPPAFSQIAGYVSNESRDSLENIEALEGIRRPRSESPAIFHGSSSSVLGTRLSRTDSGTSGASGASGGSN